MRTFWSIIAVAGIATIILWTLERRPEPAGPGAAWTETGSSLPPRRSTTAQLPGSPAPPDPTTAPLPDDPNTPATSPDSPAGERMAPADTPAEPAVAPTEVYMTRMAPEETGLDLGMDRTIAHATVVPGTIVRTGPTELRVDGEFELKGSGTLEDPYLPSWEYLFSAGGVYKPRQGVDDLPQRIALLDDQWVTIAGHTAFPLVTGESSEMLVMLNQWDGCCIGVPPTPFDAIEVRLQEAVPTGPKHSFNYGTVTGRMKVDPYLIQDWLVGLYILEESELRDDL